MKLALLVANRGFFPSSVIEAAYADMRRAAQAAGVELLEIDKQKVRYGAVETTRDGMVYRDFLQSHRGGYDGVIVCLPNFGDENGIKAALCDADVPVLLQAYPDEIGKMDFAHRRDAFCGKLALCAVFKQMGFKFTTGKPFVTHPLDAAFGKELEEFVSVCRVVRGMRHMRLGVFGARTTAFKSVRYDEGAMEMLGCDTEALDLTMIFDKYNAIADTDENVRFFRDKLLESGRYEGTAGYALPTLARLGAAFRAIIDEMRLDAIAVRCWSELQAEYKIAPCALLGILNQIGIPAVCETDASNAIAMAALSLASDRPAGCLDINNNYGLEPDKAILFHCGPLAMDLMTGPGHIQEHKMFVKTQGTDCSWGVNVGHIKPGEITISGMRTENGQVRYYVECAQITEDPVEPEFFGTSGVIRLEGLQDKLWSMANEGFRHHTIITPGNHVRAVTEALSKYLGYVRIEL
jgi:L-fucose isomerase-like protein